MRPYARATDASTGSGSKLASARCSLSWRRARSWVSVVACGPAASSANVTAEIANSAGSSLGATCSRPMTTEVSITPRRAVGSATRRRVVVEHSVDVGPETIRLNRRGAGEGRDGGVGSDELARPQRNQLANRHTVPGHHERFPAIECSHHIATAIAQFPLGDLTRHPNTVAPVLHTASDRWNGKPSAGGVPNFRDRIVFRV